MNTTSLFIFFILNRNDFKIYINKKIAIELLIIGLPLMPTFLIYWVFHSMDRIMITKMIGISELGVYSVGSKVASISQLIYTAFAGGWSYFSFSTMKDENQVKTNSKIFEYLGLCSFIAFIIAQPFIKPIFYSFFSGNYIRGYEVFSYLFLSPLLLMLFQVIANQAIVIKKSYLATCSLLTGCITNLILNYVLIKYYGIRGAAFATLLSYMISVIIMSLICLKHNLLKLERKFVLVCISLFIGIFFNFFLEERNIIYYFVYVSTFISMILFYSKDLKKLKNEVCRDRN
jgi:O-antigen/teichoic acid export membrane protein